MCIYQASRPHSTLETSENQIFILDRELFHKKYFIPVFQKIKTKQTKPKTEQTKTPALLDLASISFKMMIVMQVQW